MKVAEVFYSLQGEGRLTGVPSVFVRLAGCPVRCPWCDTRYAWDPQAGVDLDAEAIIQRLGQWPSRFVVITGGEPMATMDLKPRPELRELTCRLKARGYHVTVETSGAVFVPDLACDLMSISPKVDGPSTGPGRRVAGDVEAVRQLIGHYEYQLKFVVHLSATVGEIRGFLEKLGRVDPSRVMLMPRGQTRDELLANSPRVAQMCLDNGWVFCQRLHVLLWDALQGR